MNLLAKKILLVVPIALIFLSCKSQKSYDKFIESKIYLAPSTKPIKILVPAYLDTSYLSEISKDTSCLAENALVYDANKSFIKETNDQRLPNVIISLSIRYNPNSNCLKNNYDYLSTYFRDWVSQEKSHTTLSLQDSIFINGKMNYYLATANGDIGNARAFIHLNDKNIELTYLISNLQHESLVKHLQETIKSFHMN